MAAPVNIAKATPSAGDNSIVSGTDAPSLVPLIVVMGVSGCGKTTVGRRLAMRLAVPFLDADEFHPPANIAKMTAGIPLTDEDRAPWLAVLADQLRAHVDRGGVVIACSALKRHYRDVLRSGTPAVRFLYLQADRETIGNRVVDRHGHFMPAALLDSQFAALEPPGPDEAVILDASLSLDIILRDAIAELKPCL